MTTLYWLLGLTVATVVGVALKRLGRQEDAVSSAWRDEQIRKTGRRRP